MSILNKSGAALYLGFVISVKETCMVSLFNLLITREESLCCSTLLCKETKKDKPLVGPLPVDDRQTLRH